MILVVTVLERGSPQEIYTIWRYTSSKGKFAYPWESTLAVPKYYPILPYTTITQPIYRWYMFVYISGTLPRVPNFSLRHVYNHIHILAKFHVALLFLLHPDLMWNMVEYSQIHWACLQNTTRWIVIGMTYFFYGTPIIEYPIMGFVFIYMGYITSINISCK